jgi:integrase
MVARDGSSLVDLDRREQGNGEDVKTVQELLRHANSRITLDVYTQAVNSNKRAAQSKVVRMMVSDVGQKREENYSQTVQ